jgi:hypothetical protein
MVCPTQDGVKVLHKEVGVFEIEQQPQGYDYGKGTKPFFCRDVARNVFTPHRPNDEIIDNAFADKQKHKVGGTVGIKHDGEEQERIVSEFLRRNEIGYHEDRQKKEKEYVTTEYHED